MTLRLHVVVLAASALVASGCSKSDSPSTDTGEACGSKAPRIVSLQVTANGAPVSRAEIGQAVTIAVTAVDPDASCGDAVDSYDWSFVSVPAGSVAAVPAANTAGSLTFTPDVAGTYQFSVVAVDKHGNGSEAALATVPTGPCGPAIASPGIAAVPSTPMAGQPVSLTAGAVTDACVAGGAVRYAWSFASRPAGSVAVLANAAAPSAAFTPDVEGAYVVQLVVTDEGGFSTVVSTTLPVGTCIVPPQLGAIAFTPAAPDRGDRVFLALPETTIAACPDPRALDVSYAWTLLSRPAGSSSVLAPAGSGAVLDVDVAGGTWDVMVVATDGIGNVSAPAFTTVYSTWCGAYVPTAVLSGPGAPVNARSPTTISGSVTTANSYVCPAQFAQPPSSFTWSWQIVSQPLGSAPSLTASGASATLVADQGGSYVVEAVATGPDGAASAPARTTISVLACGSYPPAVTSVATTVGGAPTSRPSVGSTVVLTPSAFDMDTVFGGVCGSAPFGPGSFVWSLVSAPAGSRVAVEPVPTLAPLQFTADLAGTYQFRVLAVDALGLSSEPVAVTVPTGACGPSVPSIGASSTFPTVGQTVTLTSGPVTDACISNPSFAYAWRIAPRPAASAAALASTGVPGTSFVPDVPGDYLVELVVTDSGGFSTIQTLTLTAGACTSAPSLGPIAVSAREPDGSASETVFRGDLVSLSASVAAPSCGPAGAASFTYEWAMLARPDGSGAVLGGGDSPTPSFVADVAGGSWTVMLVVHDAAGNPSQPAYATIAASDCGARRPGVLLQATPATPNAHQAAALTPVFVDPSLGCPARFLNAQNVWSAAWGIASSPAGSHPQLVANGANATFLADVPGDYTVQVVATNVDGTQSLPVTKALVVGMCGTYPPVATSFQAAQLVPNGSPIATSATVSQGSATALLAFDTGFPIVVQATVADQDTYACGLAQATAWAWSLVSVPALSRATLLNPDQAAPSFTPDVPGIYVLALTTTDDLGNASTSRFQLTTSSCGTNPPVVAMGGPYAAPLLAATQLVPQVTLSPGAPPATYPILRSSSAMPTVPFYVGYPVQLSATVADADASCGFPDTASYAWSFTSLPAWSAAALNDRTLAMPSFTPDVPGEYDLQLVLTDSTGRSTTTRFSTFGGIPYLSVGGCNTEMPTPIVQVTSPFSGANASKGVGEPNGVDVLLDGSQSTTQDAIPVSQGGCGLSKHLSYDWSFDVVPSGGGVSLSTGESGSTFYAPRPGNYVVRLTVSDGTRSAATTTAIATAMATVTSGSGQMAFTASAVDPTNGREVLAWLEIGAASSPLRVARCSAGCDTLAPTWIVITVDDLGGTPFTWAAGEEPRPLDVKVTNAGTIVLAYGNGPNVTPRVAACGAAVATISPAGAISSSVVGVESGCDAGQTVGNQLGRWLSLALRSGDLPSVAMTWSRRGASASNVRYVECGALPCTGSASAFLPPQASPWTTATSGRWVSLTATPAGSQLAFAVDSPSPAVQYAACTGSCTQDASWTRRSVPGGSGAGARYTSLALSPAGQPRIAYADASWSEALLNTCDDSCAGAGTWSSYGWWTGQVSGLAFALDATGAPRVAYLDPSSGNAMFGASSSCSVFPGWWTVDLASGAPSLSVLGSGAVRVTAPAAGALKSIRYGQ